MKALSMELTGSLLVMTVAITVGLGILYSLSAEGSEIDTAEGDCSSVEKGAELNYRGFKALTAQYAQGNCKQEKEVVLDFTLTGEKIRETARDTGMVDATGDEKVVFRASCEPLKGFKGILIGEEDQKVLAQEKTRLVFQPGSGVTICPV